MDGDTAHRPVAHRTALGVLVGLVLVGTAVGCGDSEPASSAGSAPAASASASVKSPPVVTAPPGKTVAEATSSCVSTTAASPIDLRSTTVEIGEIPGRDGTSAEVTMKYSGELPTTGTVLWSLMASNPDGDSVQLGYKTDAGRQVAYFWFPTMQAQQHDLDGLPGTGTPGEIVMVLPQAALDVLGPSWWWSSVLTVDGKDIDTC